MAQREECPPVSVARSLRAVCTTARMNPLPASTTASGLGERRADVHKDPATQTRPGREPKAATAPGERRTACPTGNPSRCTWRRRSPGGRRKVRRPAWGSASGTGRADSHVGMGAGAVDPQAVRLAGRDGPASQLPSRASSVTPGASASASRAVVLRLSGHGRKTPLDGLKCTVLAHRAGRSPAGEIPTSLLNRFSNPDQIAGGLGRYNSTNLG